MKKSAVLPLFLLISLVALLGMPFIGGRGISLEAVFNPQLDDVASMIFWKIRFPRACLAWLAGAGLAAAGMAFQALFRNGLASPFTLGVSSGASFGAALGVQLGFGASILGFSGISAAAMLGALVSIGIVYGITVVRRNFSTGAMLLAGIAVNFCFSSMILLIQYIANFHDTYRILRWLMGGLQMVGMETSLRVLPFVAGGTAVLFLLVRELNMLTIGEELAASRGVHVARVKTILFLVVSGMVGVIVSVCGPLGFVGLMCPIYAG